jgi:hypothetical protein
VPQIEWRESAKEPGVVYGHVDGEDPPRFAIEGTGTYAATDLSSSDVPQKRQWMFSKSYAECVDWCWQRLPAHESPTGGQS